MSLLITCEHGGNDIPEAFAELFAPYEELLRTHRGYDIGALPIFQHLIEHLPCGHFHSTVSRLLIELNRSLHHPNLYSVVTKPLPKPVRLQLIEGYHRTYHEAVREWIMAQTGSVQHVAVHTFTPALNGQVRNADIGLLYDPRRNAEKKWAVRLKKALLQSDPALRVRFNYPYLGKADGLPTSLRKMFPDARYAGIELEVNQQFAFDNRLEWVGQLLERVIAETLGS